jgi:hypothetical protein
MDSWSKQQCNLNFLEAFLTEYNPEALQRIFEEGSVAASPTASVAASPTASVNSEQSHPSSLLDDDEEIDDDEEEDDSDENKEGPDDNESEDDSDSDIIMTPANTYELTSRQRVMFVDEIQEACQPVRARKRFFEMCRTNSPQILFIKPDGLL